MKMTKVLLMVLAFILAVALGVLFELFIWRKVHPQAPAWTFIFN